MVSVYFDLNITNHSILMIPNWRLFVRLLFLICVLTEMEAIIMKNPLFLVFIFLCVLIFSACKSDKPIEIDLTSATSQDMLESNGDNKSIWDILENGDLLLSNELMELFYEYYRKNPSELQLLPSFALNDIPNWDELTNFILVMSETEERDSEGYSWLRTELFEQTVKRYFPDFTYIHHSSAFLTFMDEGYRSVGYDNPGVVYYRLLSIINDGGYYFAEFAGFGINEGDFLGYSEGKNTNAIKDAINMQEINNPQLISEAMLQIFKQNDYAEKLELTEQVRITFRKSNNPGNAFTYLSCERQVFSQ